ncbi:MAG: hypothetical protein ACRCS6_09590 [Turicibacter sp.]
MNLDWIKETCVSRCEDGQLFKSRSGYQEVLAYNFYEINGDVACTDAYKN